MITRGETTRSLGGAVGATSGAVTGWRNGATPRPDMTKRIADHFGVSVEVLVDDSRDLPAEYEAPKVGEAAEHLVSAPIAKAAQLADAVGGSPEVRQAAFETYLRHIRTLREEAEKLTGGNAEAAVAVFDRMLAAWMAGAPETSSKERDQLKKISDEASRIIHGIPPTDPEWRAALEKLIELRNRAAHGAAKRESWRAS